MSYSFYKVLHLLGIMVLLSSLGGLVIQGLLGATSNSRVRKLLAASHGVALLVVFVAGFGLMARKGIVSGTWPLWIFAKLAIWLLFGASLTLVRRTPSLATVWFFVVPLLGAAAASFAIYQPQ